ncbi:MAG TPA: VOC family protein [Nitrospiria bacterium]|nr:VOC family protein [Nitrospiria bacterium]
MTQPIPDGYHAVTPNFTFKDSQKAIEFYQKAFDAKVLFLMKRPDGRGVMHATIRIGDSILMMGDESPQCQSAQSLGGSPISLYIYTPDADALFKRAVTAGGTETMPMADMFWGDRAGSIRDPFGYSWMIGTHTRDLAEEQIWKGAETFFSQMAKH